MQKIAEQKIAEEKDRNARSKMKTALKDLNNIPKIAKKMGLFQDEDLLKNLKYVLDYGYSQHFELQIHPFDRQSDLPFFSALLKRDHLREDDSLLVKKFSRQAQGEFFLLGIICQCPKEEKIEPSEDAQTQGLHGAIDNIEQKSEPLRRVIDSMVSGLKSLEDVFTGRLENEIILDPLAVYREV